MKRKIDEPLIIAKAAMKNDWSFRKLRSDSGMQLSRKKKREEDLKVFERPSSVIMVFNGKNAAKNIRSRFLNFFDRFKKDSPKFPFGGDSDEKGD